MFKYNVLEMSIYLAVSVIVSIVFRSLLLLTILVIVSIFCYLMYKLHNLLSKENGYYYRKVKNNTIDPNETIIMSRFKQYCRYQYVILSCCVALLYIITLFIVIPII